MGVLSAIAPYFLISYFNILMMMIKRRGAYRNFYLDCTIIEGAYIYIYIYMYLNYFKNCSSFFFNIIGKIVIIIFLDTDFQFNDTSLMKYLFNKMKRNERKSN